MTGSGKDNRNLVDSGGNQKLSHEDIAKMKEDGVSGQVRVIYLCVFFHKFRSMYSQDPWFQRYHRFEAFEIRVINKVINPKIHQGNPVGHKNKYTVNFTIEEQLVSNKSYFYLW